MIKAAKLKKLEDQVRIGGKGTARRKHKHVQRTSAFDEKRLQSALQKLAVTPISDIQRATITMNDGREMIIDSPKVQGSVVCNMFAFSGEVFEVLMNVPNNEPITLKNELKRNLKEMKEKQQLERQQQQQQSDSDDDGDEENYESEDNVPLLVSVASKPETIREKESVSNDELLKLASTKSNIKVECDKAGKRQIENVMQQQQEQEQEQLSKDKKKKKPKKPRIRIRSRNKTVGDGLDKPNYNGSDIKSIAPLDGSGDGPANHLNQNQSNLDLTDCASLGDSDKTSIFSDSSDRELSIVSDNDSFMTLCPNDEGDDEFFSCGEK